MARSSLVRSVIRGLSRMATPTTRTTVGFQRPMSSLGDDFIDPEKSKYRLTREESPVRPVTNQRIFCHYLNGVLKMPFFTEAPGQFLFKGFHHTAKNSMQKDRLYLWRYTLGKHRSNAMELIEKQPVIEVEGHMAVCDGGGGALGHPLEYIKVGHMHGSVKKCIYCGLKYKQKAGGH
eukprot:scaffold421184_cov56-Attheya_sp.AAC.6